MQLQDKAHALESTTAELQGNRDVSRKLAAELTAAKQEALQLQAALARVCLCVCVCLCACVRACDVRA